MARLDLSREFVGADFGDARLSRRLVALAQQVSREPDLSFPQLLGDSELEAAYRFFGNDRVSTRSILGPHLEATRKRIGKGRCIVAHDTTTLSFRSGGNRRGLGLGSKGNQVLHAHVSLAIDELKNPHGVLGLKTYQGRAATEQSDRWLQQACRVEDELHGGDVIHVMDREADSAKLLSVFQQQGRHFVVRAGHDRVLWGEKGATTKLYDVLPSKVLARREVELAPRPPHRRGLKAKQVHPTRTGRTTTLCMAACRHSIPAAKGDSSTRFEVNVVHVWEDSPPSGEPPVRWVLLTSEPVDSEEQILEIVDCYRARWVIEEFFKALKSGCAIEKRQLESRESLENALGLMLPIAWGLLRLRSALRATPEASGHSVLTPIQLALLRSEGRSKLPNRPTVKQLVYAIAAMGGHLKRNGDPGWQTLARGYERLLTLTRGFTLAGNMGPHEM